MRVAMVVGALLLNLVFTGIYESGLIDPAGVPETAEFRAFDDKLQPPPAWP